MKFSLALSFCLFTSTVYSAPEFWNSSLESTQEVSLSEPATYDYSYNFQPGINLFSDAIMLTDLIGSKGSQLCAPVAITHVFNFLKLTRKPSFPNLLSVPDEDRDGTANTYRDQIRYFFRTCETDREIGTYYSKAINCMSAVMTASGYKPWAYMIGPHTRAAPPGTDLSAIQRPVTLSDVAYYTSAGAGVVMTVGWYKLNAAGSMYERTGGHFFNVYGFDYNKAWGDSRMIIKSVNSWIDYIGRDPSAMFDDVEMVKVTGTQIPAETKYELKGPGFIFSEYRAFVEDIMVMIPDTSN